MEIEEVINSDGKSTFYPRFRLLGFLWWVRWSTMSDYSISFDTLEGARDWLNYDDTKTRKFHSAKESQ